MDSNHMDQADKSSPEPFSDSSGSPDSPDTSDIFGEPLVHPRVGDEYQVEVPPILGEAELLHLMMNPADSENVHDASHSFLMGLPIPVMWVCNQANPIKEEKIEFINNPCAISTNGPLNSENVAMSQASLQKKEPTVKVDGANQTSDRNLYCIVPGQSTDSWSDFEADCFLLGLYIFGKNLLLVRQFMDSKDMGQILSFYYGRFYGSDEYRKWTECRKMRNRKCVLGHRFFTGYRQQELYSRLLPHLCEQSRTKFLEASRAFAEGRTSLDEYVSMLKTLVGIRALVEAVGIGKGKDDLTTFVVDSSKNNSHQMNANRPEMPSGKACSSLTRAEIVKYLTGDFRLSKARSNDLFWEAVWPRLLARGWHSEQPRGGDGYTGSKNCLVFLMPGIKKFSRRKLTKGDHYFDSVSDVLAKVGSEPELLELEADETRPSNSSKEEQNGWAVEVNSDGPVPSDHDRPCYLKPRVSTGLSNLTKFTVVDTSLAYEDNQCKVRELRSLPLEAKRSSNLSRRLRKAETQLHGNADIALPNDLQSSTSSHGKGLLQNDSLDTSKRPADANMSAQQKSRAIKHQFSRRVRPGLSNCPGTVTKRRRLSSCVESDVTYVLSLPAGDKNGAHRGTSKNAVPPKTSQPRVKVLSADVSSVPGSSDKKTLEESLNKKILEESLNKKVPEESLNGNQVNSDCFKENERALRAEKVIDLNLLPHPTEPEIDNKVNVGERENEANQHFEADKSSQKMEAVENNVVLVSDAEKPKQKVEKLVDNNTNQCSDVEKPKDSDTTESLVSTAASKDGGFDQQPRRQSTRNRPLTTKALEALEIGFLNPVRQSRKRSPSTTQAQDQKSKRSRQPRNKSSMSPNVPMGSEERGADGSTCNGKTSTMGNPPYGPVQIKTGAAAHELLGLSKSSHPSQAP